MLKLKHKYGGSMTNSQRIQKIIDEYKRQLIEIEKMLIVLHGSCYVLKLDQIRLSSGLKSQKRSIKSAITWAAVNAIPLTLGLITLNPFSISLSGGLVVFETGLGISSYVKSKKLEKQLKKLEKTIERAEKYNSHLESQREFLDNKICDLEELLDKAKAKGIEPTDQMLIEAMQGKTQFLLEQGSNDEYATADVIGEIEERSRQYGCYDDSYDAEIE